MAFTAGQKLRASELNLSKSTLSLATGWSRYSTSFGAPLYWKDLSDVVHLSGLVKSGTGSTTLIGTLPSGYRPATIELFALLGDRGGVTGAYRIDVTQFGELVLTLAPAYAFLSLNGITFPVNNNGPS